MRIVGVHGIGQRKYLREADPAGAITEAWRTSFGGEDWRVAYWTHLLDRGTAQGPDVPANLDEGELDLLLDWADLIAPAGVAQGPKTARARGVLDWLVRAAGPAAKPFAMAFTREVHTYLKSPESPRRQRARQAVADLVERHRPQAVVAHSLGSVIAYEALWTPGPQVPLLVTLGSPLGMEHVVFRRLALGREGARPPRVRRWLNLADVGDLVAVPRDGIGKRYEGVEILPDVTIGTDLLDFHYVDSYLRCPQVREAVLRGWDRGGAG